MRRELDAYETPAWYVQQLLERVSIYGPVFEPCVGDGAISRFFPHVTTNDINPNCTAHYHFDASVEWGRSMDGLGIKAGVGFSWIVTNPPFNLAQPILEQSLARCPRVAMIMRISFLEPTKKREQFLLSNPPDGLIYLPRHSFTGDGKSDMSTVAWMIWGHVPIGGAIQVAPRFPEAGPNDVDEPKMGTVEPKWGTEAIYGWNLPVIDPDAH